MRMSDAARHDATEQDNGGLRHTLSLSEVETALTTAGVPRSHRHIQRLCKSGAFDAQLLPGPSGDEWRIAPHSVAKVIGDLRAINERRRHGATEHATSDHAVADIRPETEPDTARHDATARATSQAQEKQEPTATETATTRYVAALERENDFLRGQIGKKDEQLADLSTRFGETQTLLGALQRMLAPALGQPDPFTTPAKREIAEPDLSPQSP
jgi:hypothetical protein